VPSRSVVVFGDDRAALAVAGGLALAGHDVVLWESPSADIPVAVPCERPLIRLSGAGGEREATLAAATSDPFEALAAGDVLLTCASPHGLSAVADQVLPLIEPRHTMVLLAGGLHPLAAAKWLHDRGRSGLPTLVASDTAPFAGLSFAGDRLHIAAAAAHVGFGVFPACRTEATIAVLADLFPGATAHAHVLAAALATVEPMLRATALLMNLGAVERPRAGFSLFEDGFTQGVTRVAEALDGERLALGTALGLDLPVAAEALHAWGLSPDGDLWAAVNGSFALTQASDADLSVAGRLAADVAFGLRAWVELADQLDVPAPLARSLMELFKAAMSVGLADSGWSLDDLGIAGMSGAALQRFLATGDDESAT
jgi:opine dehydrogenase